MSDEDFQSWGNVTICVVILFLWLFFTYGCAHTPPSLNITEAQVDAKIQELMAKPSGDGIQYDAENDVYVVKPETARILANDELRLHIYEEEILPEVQEYLADNPPMTIGKKAKWAGIGAIVGILLGIAGVIAMGGL